MGPGSTWPPPGWTCWPLGRRHLPEGGGDVVRRSPGGRRGHAGPGPLPGRGRLRHRRRSRPAPATPDWSAATTSSATGSSTPWAPSAAPGRPPPASPPPPPRASPTTPRTGPRPSPMPAPATAALAPGGDVDWFAVDVAQPATLTVTLAPPSGPSSAEHSLEVFDPGLFSLASATAVSSPAAVTVNAGPRRYAMRVRGTTPSPPRGPASSRSPPTRASAARRRAR